MLSSGQGGFVHWDFGFSAEFSRNALAKTTP